MRLNSKKRSGSLFLSAIAAVLVIFLPLSSAVAQSREELEEKQRQVELEKAEAESHVEGIDSDLAQLFVELADIDRRLPIAEAELVDAENDLAAQERNQALIEERLATAERQQLELEVDIAEGDELIASTETTLGALARDAYRGGGSVSLLAVVLETESPQDFTARYASMNGVMRNQNHTINEVEDLQAVNRNRESRLVAVKERVEELKIEADEAVAAAEASRNTARNLVTEISNLKSDKETKVSDLDSRKGELNTQIANLESEGETLGAEIKEIDRIEREKEAKRIADEEAARKAKAAADAAEEKRRKENASRNNNNRPAPSTNSGGSNSGGNSSGGSSSGGSNSGGSSGGSNSGSGWVRPVTNTWYVTSSYGYRIYPITGGRFFHRGVDLRSRCGEAQRSVRAGTVSAVRNAYGNGTHGNQVMVNHGMVDGSTYVSVYNHLSSFNVSVGQRIPAGHTIGTTGATGAVTGCHVHLEIWKNGSTINPMTLPGY